MKNLYKIGQAAKIIGVSIDTLRRWDEDGILIPAYKTPGGTRFYSKDQVFNTKPLRGRGYKKRQPKPKKGFWQRLFG